ncbi:hypothetical protein GN958_ATG15389, partial [Phytophthora infestans]
HPRQGTGLFKTSAVLPSAKLTRLAKTTRALLAQAFHKKFFIRYTDPSRFRNTAYIPEMQLLLRPLFKNHSKNLATIVKLCNEFTKSPVANGVFGRSQGICRKNSGGTCPTRCA